MQSHLACLAPLEDQYLHPMLLPTPVAAVAITTAALVITTPVAALVITTPVAALVITTPVAALVDTRCCSCYNSLARYTLNPKPLTLC